MLERLRDLGILPNGEDEENGGEEDRFAVLRILVGNLFLATGVNATLQHLRREPRPAEAAPPFGERPQQTTRYELPAAAAWAPTLLAPLAGAAQVVEALRPSENSLLATRILNGVAVGFGLAGIAESIYSATRGTDRIPLAPLLFGYTGLLGMLLEREENRVAEEREALERRARIVERLVPRRRPRLEKIVVHV